MSTLHKHRPLSPTEYLEAEKRSDVKHEYVAGRTYAMVGTSATHLLADMAAVEDLSDLEDI